MLTGQSWERTYWITIQQHDLWAHGAQKGERAKGVASVRISWLCWRVKSLSLFHDTVWRGCFGQSVGRAKGRERSRAWRFIWFLPRLSFLPAAQNNGPACHLRRVLFCLPPTNGWTDGLSEFNLFLCCIHSRSTGHEYSMRNGLFTGAPRHQGLAHGSHRPLNWTLNYYELRSAACGVRAAICRGAAAHLAEMFPFSARSANFHLAGR